MKRGDTGETDRAQDREGGEELWTTDYLRRNLVFVIDSKRWPTKHWNACRRHAMLVSAFGNKYVCSTLIALATMHCLAQSNIYSLSIYSGGTSYTELCSYALPTTTNKFKLTVVSWLEDANGFTVIDIDHKRTATDVPRRFLEVQCSAECFWFDLDFSPSKRASLTLNNCTKVIATGSSGDLIQAITECATNRGSFAITNRQPVSRSDWIRVSREALDIIVVEGDRFATIQKLLEQVFGAPDADLHSTSPIGNGRSITYTPDQIGVAMNLAGNSTHTVLSIVGKRRR